MCKNKNEWPCIGMEFPDYYLAWKDQYPKDKCFANNDFCVIDHGDQVDHFIHGITQQKIKGTNQILEYGPWVSVSKAMLLEYEAVQKLKIDKHGEPLGLGYWANRLPFYNIIILNIPCKIFYNKIGLRPIIEPDAQFDHPFVNDFYNGIDIECAKKIIKLVYEKGQKCQHLD